MAKSKKMVLMCLLIISLIFGGTAIASSIIDQKNKENADDGSDYSAYLDNSEAKERIKNIQVGKESISVSYVRTENLKEKPVSQRKSLYGTYDVFVDSEGTEYLYLINTKLFCGYKKPVVGIPLPLDDAISKETATQICEKYIKENRDSYKSYRLSSCFYDERGGYYDCEYSLYLSEIKTDDVLRVWVDSEGHLTAVSEFNRERYDKCSVTIQQCTEARKKAIDEFNRAKKCNDYAEVDCFLSQNDDAEWIYVIVLDVKIPCDKDMYVVQRERIERRLE